VDKWLRDKHHNCRSIHGGFLHNKQGGKLRHGAAEDLRRLRAQAGNDYGPGVPHQSIIDGIFDRDVKTIDSAPRTETAVGAEQRLAAWADEQPAVALKRTAAPSISIDCLGRRSF